MSTQNDVALESVRVVYRDQGLSLEELLRKTTRLIALIVAAGGDLNDELSPELPNLLEEFGPPDQVLIDRGAVYRAEVTVGNRTSIDRIKYNSPLEIVISIGSVSTMVLALAARWAKVRERLAKSTTVVKSEKVKQAALDTVLLHLQDTKQQHVLNRQGRHHIQLVLDEAASALTEIEKIESL